VSLRGKRVLVTGADGFLGSHLAERLVREGASVRALVWYNAFDSRGWLDTAPADVVDAIEIVPGEIRDTEQMRRLADGVEVVLHLAALIAIPFSYDAPRSYVETNVIGTLNLLEAARGQGVAHFVHTSSSEVYGTARRVPIDEAHPLAAQSPYAATKIAADQLALSYHRSFGLPVTVLRPFNAYGPRQSLRAVIPSIILQVLAGEEPLRLGRLDTTRDFTFAADVVEGFLAAAASDTALGDVVQLGSGFEVSIRRTAELIGELCGRVPTIVSEPRRERPATSEVERLVADAAKAERLFGWRPAHAGLEGFRRGLRATIDWYSDPGNRRHYRQRVFAL
jgi:dTDP-glucose 4,6-dehydratase